jgi:hypothetical protein
MRHNREAFERWRVVPRMLHGLTQRNLATSVVGIRLSAPLLLAPIGAASLVAANSDVIIARGAASAGTPYVISSQGCNPMEDTAAAMGLTPFWYQLYWSTDEGLVDSMIGRAESCGARALVVTLDTILGWRPRDLNLGSLPFARGQGIAQYTSDPRFTEIVRLRLAAGIDRAKTRASFGAVRTLVSMSREHPGAVRKNLQSPEPRAAVETFSTSTQTRDCPGITSRPSGIEPPYPLCSKAFFIPTTRDARLILASTGSSCRTTAAGRLTMRSPPLMRSSPSGMPWDRNRRSCWTVASDLAPM